MNRCLCKKTVVFSPLQKQTEDKEDQRELHNVLPLAVKDTKNLCHKPLPTCFPRELRNLTTRQKSGYYSKKCACLKHAIQQSPPLTLEYALLHLKPAFEDIIL